MRTKLYFLAALMLIATQALSQILVNKSWEQLSAAPKLDVDWSVSQVDNSGRLVTAGNNYNETDENYNFYVSKTNPADGSLFWEVEWNGPNDLDDFATGLFVTSDAIYVCGLAKYSNSASDWIVQRLDPQDGAVVWTYTHTDSYAISATPADIIFYDGDLFITGTVLKGTTASDYLTMRLDDEYGTLIWDEEYDYNNVYDAGVKLTAGSDYVFVAGASGSALTNVDITMLRYDASDGSNASATTSYSASDYLDVPTDIEMDTDGNVYVCGRFYNQTSVDMKVIKLDNDLTIDWEAEYDHKGLYDEANALCLDNEGNCYVIGTGTKSAGSDMIVVKYNIQGGQEWKKNLMAQPHWKEAKGKKIEFNGEVLAACGTADIKGNGRDIITSFINPETGHIHATANYNHDGSNNDNVSSIVWGGGNTLFISGTVMLNNTKRYVAVEYEYYLNHRETLFDENDQPVCAKNEVIVQFYDEALNLSVVDENDRSFATLEDYLTNAALTEINGNMGKDVKGWKASKMYGNKKSTDTTVTTFDGHVFDAFPFYTYFIVYIPTGNTLLDVSDAFSEAQDFVRTVSWNQGCKFLEETNDEYYYAAQGALHPIPNDESPIDQTPLGTNYDIGANDAWEYSMGSPLITIGNIDSGLLFEHEDLNIEYEPNNFYSPVILAFDASGGLVGGNLPLLYESDTIEGGHGTKTTGIMVGISNNALGISGIAGGTGDYSDLGDPYAMPTNLILVKTSAETVNGTQTDSQVWTFATHSLLGWQEIGNAGYGNILNNSWTVVQSNIVPDEYTILDDIALACVYYSRLGAVLVCARGNTDSDFPEAPATTISPYDNHYYGCNEDYVLSVGSSGINGWRAPDGYGYDMDFIAPGIAHLVSTTSVTALNNSYSLVGGTSYAAPMVSGTVALLLSKNYLDWALNLDNSVQMFPEDVEHILERSCFDLIDSVEIAENEFEVYTEGYDDYTGHGRIDAADALAAIDLSANRLWHEVIEDDADITITLIDEEVELYYNRAYDEWQGGLQNNPSGIYLCDVYEITAIGEHDLQGSTLVDAWMIPSRCNGLGFIEQVGADYINQFSAPEIIAVDDQNIQVKAYMFLIHFPDMDIWYPKQEYQLKFEYTLYTTSGLAVEETKPNLMQLFPNPSSYTITLQIPSAEASLCSLQVLDATGRLVETQKCVVGGATKVTFDISGYAAGFYTCLVTNDRKRYAQHFIKQ